VLNWRGSYIQSFFGMDFAAFEFWEGSGLEIINVAEILDYIGRLRKLIITKVCILFHPMFGSKNAYLSPMTQLWMFISKLQKFIPKSLDEYIFFFKDEFP
jgi:hypothetical protein